MDVTKTLEPDQRWAGVCKCYSHEEYLNKFFIKGRFHADVPQAIRSSYEIVERIIAYSYFHYPMIEEAISKMTRIFEMSVKIKTKSFGIDDSSLYNCLNMLKKRSAIDSELAAEWDRLRDIRNFYAHPDNIHFSGPTPLEFIYPMINAVNKLFCPVTLFEASDIGIVDLINRVTDFKEGAFILESQNTLRLVTFAQPYYMSPDRNRSLWHLTPVYVLSPQTVDEYFDLDPFFIRIKDVHVDNGMIFGIDYITNAAVVLYKTDVVGNVNAARSFKRRCESAEETVKSLHEQNIGYQRYLEKQKFIYDEFWGQTN